MTDSVERPISALQLISLGRPYWLPPSGYGNGLDALFWAQLARVPHPLADRLLLALRERDIPGWVAPVERHHPEPVDAAYDVWTATTDIDAAEDVAMTVMNDLRPESRPPDVDPPGRPSTRRLRGRARSRSRSGS